MAPAAGVFSANPLSLSVPEPAFESWLRETGYLEVLDERASSSSAAASSGAAKAPRRRRAFSNSAASNPGAAASSSLSSSSDPAAAFLARGGGRGSGGLKGVVNLVGGSALLSVVRTFISILTINPFARLAAEDFSGSTPPWTVGFLTAGGQSSSYSWPAGPSLARMRVQENVKRYARNYASLWFLVLACTL